jgi:hypothetical protein
MRIGSQRENCFENTLGFQLKIDDLPLKCCILGENPKNKSTRSHCKETIPFSEGNGVS